MRGSKGRWGREKSRRRSWRKGRRKSRRRRGRKNNMERGGGGRRNISMRKGIKSMRMRRRKTGHSCITKSQHFSLTFKQRALWKLEQNIRAIYCYQNLYLILVHGQ